MILENRLKYTVFAMDHDHINMPKEKIIIGRLQLKTKYQKQKTR